MRDIGRFWITLADPPVLGKVRLLAGGSYRESLPRSPLRVDLDELPGRLAPCCWALGSGGPAESRLNGPPAANCGGLFAFYSISRVALTVLFKRS